MVTAHSSANEMLVSAIFNDVHPLSHLPCASQEWQVEVDKSTSLTASMSDRRRHWSSLTIEDQSQVASCMIHGPTFAVPWQDTLRSKQPGDSQHGGSDSVTNRHHTCRESQLLGAAGWPGTFWCPWSSRIAHLQHDGLPLPQSNRLAAGRKGLKRCPYPFEAFFVWIEQQLCS